VTRVVLDASVLASATVAHPNSLSARLLDAAKEGEIQVVACAELIAELDRALSPRYFTERLTVTVSTSSRVIPMTVPDVRYLNSGICATANWELSDGGRRPVS
jgi:predicted nucleic acid-binding protein